MGKRSGKVDLTRIFTSMPHGRICLINGPIRTGKSYLTAILIKGLLGHGFHIITNFQFTPWTLANNPRIHLINSDRSFFRAWVKIPKNENFILVLDDMQTIAGTDSRRVSGKDGLAFSDLMLYAGKLGGSCLFITHLDYRPKAITNMEPVYIWKYYKANMYIMGQDPGKSKRDRIKRGQAVPVPKIKPLAYETGDIGYFKFDMDLKDLWYYISQHPHQDLKKIIADYLDRSEAEAQESELKALSWEQITTAIYLKRPEVRGSSKLNEIIPNKQFYPVLKRLRGK